MKVSINNISDIYKAKKASVETMTLKGYELITELFVDNSGFGTPDEPALTRGQFEDKIKALLNEHGQLIAKITGEGQFQVYVGLFKKTGRGIAKIIKNNTLEVSYPDGSRAIRLHDTDIVIFKGDKITLNSGGWQTSTTKSRINEFSPFTVYQKDFEWFIVKDGDWDHPIKFEDGITL